MLVNSCVIFIPCSGFINGLIEKISDLFDAINEIPELKNIFEPLRKDAENYLAEIGFELSKWVGADVSSDDIPYGEPTSEIFKN